MHYWSTLVDGGVGTRKHASPEDRTVIITPTTTNIPRGFGLELKPNQLFHGVRFEQRTGSGRDNIRFKKRPAIRRENDRADTSFIGSVPKTVR
jgi:hypothetical protein